MKEKRKKIWIDSFQTYLMVRIAIYCIMYQAAVWIIVLIDRFFSESLSAFIGSTNLTWIVALISILFLGGLFIYDAVRLTHRVVGPLVRFRAAIRAITAGESVETLRLREGDFLLEMRDEFNEMLRALEQRGAVTLRTKEAKQEQPAAV